MHCGPTLSKKARLSADESARDDRGERGTFVQVLPRSGVMHTVHQGKRNQEATAPFVQKSTLQSDGEAPVCRSDGGQADADAIETAASDADPVPDAGRGRPRTPLRGGEANLQEAPVIKHTQPGRLVALETRMLRGTAAEIVELIRAEPRGQTMQTSDGASRNGNDRKDNKRLARRSACHAQAVS